MQRIELNDTADIARVVQDLTTLLGQKRGVEKLLLFFEQALEHGFDTFMIPIAPDLLRELDEVFLQRPYLQQKIQFITQFTPTLSTHAHIVDTSDAAISKQVAVLQECLEHPRIVTGIVALQDPLLNPLQLVESCETLIEKGVMKSVGVNCESEQQLITMQKYSDEAIVLWTQTWSDAFFHNQTRMMMFSQYQIFPLVSFFGASDLLTHPETVQLAQKYNVHSQAIVFAWMFAHPVSLCLVIEAANEQGFESAAREASHIQLTRDEWYRLFSVV